MQKACAVSVCVVVVCIDIACTSSLCILKHSFSSLQVLFCHKNLNDLNYRYLQFLLEDSQYQYGGVGTLEGTSVLPLGGSSVQK